MRKLSALLFYVAALSATAAANYFLHANPPATEPLVPASPLNPAIGAAAVPGETLHASALLLIHTQTRPLFSPTRRKWVEPEPPALEPVEPPVAAELPSVPQPVIAQTPPPDVRLIGIEKTPSGARALLVKTGAADALWFSDGEKLEGWAVQEINSGSVEMTLGERKIKLELYPPLPSREIEP